MRQRHRGRRTAGRDGAGLAARSGARRDAREPAGVWMLEAAGRPIGGLCSRVLRFESGRPGRVLLRHAAGQDVSGEGAPRRARRDDDPIPRSGVFSRAEGVEDARTTADIEAVEITAKQGQLLETSAGRRQLFGIFIRAGAGGNGPERALRRAHAALRFRIGRPCRSYRWLEALVRKIRRLT